MGVRLFPLGAHHNFLEAKFEVLCNVSAKGGFGTYDTYICFQLVFQVESKREEFRRYLEGAGVLDAFTKGNKLAASTLLKFMYPLISSCRPI